MPESDVDLLTIDRGAVAAPAGCGKTHLIASAISRHDGPKPILVLTHTNAGVVALRQRLDRMNVSPSAYRVSTIDGWAIRLISTFPARSGHPADLLKLANPRADYPNIRAAAAGLLRDGHVNDVIRANFSRLIVDEYQDCSARQHAVVTHISQSLPSCVLGDPLQAIFGFGDALVPWNEVLASFPLAGELDTPHRWINAGAEPLGRWLLEVRARLLRGDPIDLQSAPAGVNWIRLDGQDDHELRRRAARSKPPGNDGTVLIIGDSTNPDGQRLLASQTPGAVTVEAVDLKDLVAFAAAFDLNSPNALDHLVLFAQSVMRSVGAADLLQRVQSLANGKARKAASSVEFAALSFMRNPSHRAAVDVLVEIGKDAGVSAHRPAVLRACIKALQLCDGTRDGSFHEAAIKMREQNRLLGRPLPRRAVGSTLLLKGLEAEMVVIVNAAALDARNLYVALTRGSKAIVICAPTGILQPGR